MGLSSEMKNLSGDILASFKQRIKENEELVDDVQKTLEGFRKDHQEMASVLKVNAKSLKNDLVLGEKERLNVYHELMNGIHQSIVSIQKEVVAIQTSTLNIINEFSAERVIMADKLGEFFTKEKSDRRQNEKNRIEEFDALMKSIDDEIKNINIEVLRIFKNANDLLEKFEKEHLKMSVELRADLSKNLAEGVEYTRILLKGFQKRLSEISKENQKMAQELRKDLDKGEVVRLNGYNGIMKGIHIAIKGIRKEVDDIQKATLGILGDLSQDRGKGTAEWKKMQIAIAQLKTTGVFKPVQVQELAKEVEEKETKKEAPVEVVNVEVVNESLVEAQPKVIAKPIVPMTLEQKVLDYINKHPKGVKISEMEEPLGETRMKLGFIAKVLLDEGKVQKIENIYFPLRKHVNS